MWLRTKRLKSGLSAAQDNTGIVFAFEPDEVRYLTGHLAGVAPKMTHTGTIGQGMMVWFEPRGVGLWESSDGRCLEATIAARYVNGYQGERPKLKATVSRETFNDKPVLHIEPLPLYDRDAEKIAAMFNPALRPQRPAEKAVALFKPKPDLSKAEVIDIVARHSNGKTAPAPLVSSAIVPAKIVEVFRGIGATAPNELPVPVKISSADALEELKASIALVNEQMALCGDDVVFAIAEDRRRMKVVRRKVIVEEIE